MTAKGSRLGRKQGTETAAFITEWSDLVIILHNNREFLDFLLLSKSFQLFPYMLLLLHIYLLFPLPYFHLLIHGDLDSLKQALYLTCNQSHGKPQGECYCSNCGLIP